MKERVSVGVVKCEQPNYSMLFYRIKSVVLGILSVLLVGSAVLMVSPAFAATPADALNPGSVGDTSYNWAGYVASGATYTGVSGTWTVPTVAATNSSSADATWVGIGGAVSHDLIQTGTLAMTNPGSDVSYQAWYEMLPDTMQTVSLAVHPGDSMSASIAQVGNGRWSINLTNNTTHQTFQTTVNYTSSLSSADWIEEAPSMSQFFMPLDQFGSIKFTNAGAIANGTTVSLEQAGARTMTMNGNFGEIQASPSAIGSDGASFTVNRAADTTTTPVTTDQTDSSNPFVTVITFPTWTQTPTDVTTPTIPATPFFHHHHHRYTFGFGNSTMTFTFGE